MRTVPADLANHFIVGTAAALAGLVLGGVVGSVAATLLAALGRELYNVWRAGWDWSRWSWSDIVWTCLGGAAVIAGAAHGLDPRFFSGDL